MKKIIILILAIVVSVTTLLGGGWVGERSARAAQEVVQQEGALWSQCKAALVPLVEGNGAVLQEYGRLVQHVERSGLQGGELQRIARALLFAAKKHEAQKTSRFLEKVPYLYHSLVVTNTLLQVGQVHDADQLIGALLHDVREREEIAQAFGPHVAMYVGELTAEAALPAPEKKRKQIVEAPRWSVGTAQIKMADQIYNLDTLLHSPPAHWSRQQSDEYFKWVQTLLDRMPEGANPHLKQAVQSRIALYWDRDAAARDEAVP